MASPDPSSGLYFRKPKNNIPKTYLDHIVFPCVLVLLFYIMWSMYFIGDTLIRGGKTWSNYWSQLLVRIFSCAMLVKGPPDPIRSITVKHHASKRLLLLGLIFASSKTVSVPNIDLRG